MIKLLDLKDAKTAEKIVVLQKRSYAVEAELIGFYDIPPMKDTKDTIAKCDETFYGFYDGDELAGLIAYELEDDLLDICRVAVNPEHFRKGIARQMVEHIIALNKGIKLITVSTGLKNLPAVNLYLKLGFVKTRELEVEKDVYIVCFERK